MNAVFADTFYWVALANPRDAWHAAALRCGSTLAATPIVTTEEVLGEFLAFFSRLGPYWRTTAARLVRTILTNPGIHVVPQSSNSFLQGLALYEQRSDKQYSLVDCVSMHTMRDRQISGVLSHDEHFHQEGFLLLLNSEGE